MLLFCFYGPTEISLKTFNDKSGNQIYLRSTYKKNMHIYTQIERILFIY